MSDKGKKDKEHAKAGEHEVEESTGGEGKLKNKKYEKELARLQRELVKLQFWIRHKGLRVLGNLSGKT